MIRTTTTALAFLLLAACGSSEPAATVAQAPVEKAAEAPAAEKTTEGRVFFVSPEDGATVSSPVKVQFGIEGMEVKPAGEMAEGTGHHHIIINGTHVEQGKQVPADEKHIHFGGGQTETEIELEPGEYTLTMQFADGAHMSYGEDMSQSIKITVE